MMPSSSKKKSALPDGVPDFVNDKRDTVSVLRGTFPYQAGRFLIQRPHVDSGRQHV
jgi:hypothetical protein